MQLTPVKEVLFRNRCAKRMLPPFDDMNLYEPPAELPRCKCGGRIRPHLCSFGEVPFELDWIYEELDTCTLFVSVGTSGVVETAASFVANVECADNPAGTGGACERILVHGMLLGQSGRGVAPLTRSKGCVVKPLLQLRVLGCGVLQSQNQKGLRRLRDGKGRAL